MTATFYGVLGVGPDAGETEIRAAYRERVTAVHPDVNDDPAADVEFKRLTEAREALLDSTERARYDRLGHASYVRRHVSSSVWDKSLPGTGAETPAASETADHESTTGDVSGDDVGNDDAENSGHHSTSTATNQGRSSESRTVDRTRSGWTDGTASREATGPGRTTDRRTVGHSHASTDGSATVGASGSASGAERTGSTANGRNWTGVSTDSSDGRSSGRGRTRTRAPADGDAGYATSTFWASQAPGTRKATESRREPPATRLLSVLRELGPWVFVHVAFVSVAVGTGLYLLVLSDWELSLPLLLVLVGEIGLTVVLSTIHVATRLAR